MKIIYDFTVPKNEEVEETDTSTNENGEEIKTTKKVNKSVDKTFVLKRPGRKLYDEAELFYGVKLSEGIKAGLLTRALLAKRFNNDGGVLSDNEKDRFADLYMKLFEKQGRLQTLENKSPDKLSASEKKEKEGLIQELNSSREQIQEFEMAQASLFDQTAENRARNKTILWWVVHMSYEKVGKDNYIPVFGEGSYEEKISTYDELEESEEEFIEQMLNKLSYYVSFWFVTKPNSREDLEALIKASEEESNSFEEIPEEAMEESPPEPEEKKEKPKGKWKKKVKQDKQSKPENKPTDEDVGKENPQTENA